MAVLRVPELDRGPFREYYRELISESVRQSAEQSGQPHLRSSVRMVWIAAAVLLLVDLLAFGVHSWTTAVADIGLIVLTLVWFWVCVDDLIPARERGSIADELELPARRDGAEAPSRVPSGSAPGQPR